MWTLAKLEGIQRLRRMSVDCPIVGLFESVQDGAGHPSLNLHHHPRFQGLGTLVESASLEGSSLLQELWPSGKPEKYLTRLAGLFPAYSKNKPVKNGDHGIKPY
jgi:hypothetical protein